MTAHLPDTLPPVGRKERRNTKTVYRYDFNYCTFSYTMAFWDWKRWEQEIDWMALHGINLALALVGTDAWYEDRISLQKKILKRMREYGIHPVLPGYAGMLPHNAAEKIGVNVANPGTWNGYNRRAVWVVQAWGANPRPRMIENIPRGDLLVLDLYSESRPQWGDPQSAWHRKNGFDGHSWLYCMLLNYGGNVGLHGKMQHVIDAYYRAAASPFGSTLTGVGMTMEGSENNPVMYELLCELPWRPSAFSKDEWLKGYIAARYGRCTPRLTEAWKLLGNSIYNCPPRSTQQGTHESVFCARPSLKVYQVSTWSEMSDYYRPADVLRAARLFLEEADGFKGNDNFEYDLIDITRQAVAEKGRLVYKVIRAAYEAQDKPLLRLASDRFLELLLLQDRLLATRPEFKAGRWIAQARSIGRTPQEKDWIEWNARVQITTWGNRTASEGGGLHDYAHKEWNGLLRDFYYPRWKTWLDRLNTLPDGDPAAAIDYYALDEPWTLQHNFYSPHKEGDCVEAAKEAAQHLYFF